MEDYYNKSALNEYVKSNMLAGNKPNVEEVLEKLAVLDKKYHDFLVADGKWLIGGFRSIIRIDRSMAEFSSPSYKLKVEVFKMLPASIKQDIIKIVPLD